MDMNAITSEQIREGRDRLNLTQQELATAIGVSLRTIGSWERGEAVPRSKISALRSVLQFEEDPTRAVRARIAFLAVRRRRELGTGQKEFADAIGVSNKTVQAFEAGAGEPHQKTVRLFEDALDWAPGVVQELINLAADGKLQAEDITMDSLDRYEPPQHAVSVEHVPTAELLAELGRRFAVMESRVAQVAEAVNVVPVDFAAANGGPGAYGLAASGNREHLEDAEDEGQPQG